MNRQLWYIEVDGHPVPATVEEWEAWRKVDWPERLRVALDTVGPYQVSTVFLGLDHGFSRHGPPILYETMVFGPPEIMRVDPDEQAAMLADENPLIRQMAQAYGRLIGEGRVYRPEQDQERYPTRAMALEGHARMLERWGVAWEELETALGPEGAPGIEALKIRDEGDEEGWDPGPRMDR